VPPWALALLCLSKRLHSIYMLRLFNDGVAMLLAHAATALLLERRWRSAALAYSAAVSVKMSVLLMAPPVLVVMLKARRPPRLQQAWAWPGRAPAPAGAARRAAATCAARVRAVPTERIVSLSGASPYRQGRQGAPCSAVS